MWPYKLYSENALFFLKSSSLLPGIDQTNQVCGNDDQGKVYKNCRFKDPGAGVLVLGRGHISRIVKMHYFFKKSFSLLSQALIRQTKYIVMMTKDGCVYQHCKIHISHYSEYVL